MDQTQMWEMGWRAGFLVLGTVAGAMLVGMARRAPSAEASARPKRVVVIGGGNVMEVSQVMLGEALAGNVVLGAPMAVEYLEQLEAEMSAALAEHRRGLIAFADEVLVANGREALSPRSLAELEFAESRGKVVRWAAPVEDLEQIDQAPDEPEGGPGAEFHVEPSAGTERTEP